MGASMHRCIAVWVHGCIGAPMYGCIDVAPRPSPPLLLLLLDPRPPAFYFALLTHTPSPFAMLQGFADDPFAGGDEPVPLSDTDWAYMAWLLWEQDRLGPPPRLEVREQQRQQPPSPAAAGQ